MFSIGTVKFYDTDALLVLGETAFNEEFALSSVTLQELENIKISRNKSDEIKYQARTIVRLLDENSDKYNVVVYDDDIAQIIHMHKMQEYPDTQIIASAKYLSEKEDVIFVSGDIACRIIAKNIFGLNVDGVDIVEDIKYKGFKEVSLTEDDMAHFYENMTSNMFGLLTNEYLILKDIRDEVVDTLKWNGETYETIRCKPYKSNMFGTLKPLDEIQVCAMDSMNCNDITVLYGKAGSGKTTLPLNYIMQGLEKGKIKKLYVIYSFEPLKGAKTLGFEKGDHITKLLYSASIGNILASKFGDLAQVEYMIDRHQLDIIPTANIRGVEFESDSCVLVTEAQNLDVYTLKTILQRCKEGCKQIYEGDIIEQKDTNIQNIGINRLLDVFKGHKSFGCVKLKNNYRSKLSELADLM